MMGVAEEAKKRKAEREAEAKRAKEAIDKQNADIAEQQKALQDHANMLKEQMKKDLEHSAKLAEQAKKDAEHDAALADQIKIDAAQDAAAKKQAEEQAKLDAAQDKALQDHQDAQKLLDAKQDQALQDHQDAQKLLDGRQDKALKDFSDAQKSLDEKQDKVLKDHQDAQKLLDERQDISLEDRTKAQKVLDEKQDKALEAHIKAQKLLDEKQSKSLEAHIKEQKLLDAKQDKDLEEIPALKTGLTTLSNQVNTFISKDFADLKNELGDLRDNKIKEIDEKLNKLKGEDTKVNQAIDDIKGTLKTTVEKLGGADASFDKLPAAIVSKLAEINSAISAKASVTELTSQKAALELLVSTEKAAMITAQEAVLDAAINPLTIQVATLTNTGAKQQDVQKILDDISSIKTTSLTAIDGRLTEVETKTAGLIDQYTKEIPELRSEVTSVKTGLSTLSTQVKDFISKDFADLKNELGDLRDNKIKEIDEKLNKLKGEDTKVNQAIDDIKGTLKTTVEKLGGADASFDKLPAAIVSKLAEINSAISAKASVTELTSQKAALELLVSTEKAAMITAQKAVLDAAINPLTIQVATLTSTGAKQQDVQKILDDISSIKTTSLKVIDGRLTEVETKTAGLIDQYTKEIPELRSEVTSVKTGLSTLSTQVKDFISNDFSDLKKELGDLRDKKLKEIDAELNKLKGEDTKVNQAIDDIKGTLKTTVEKLGGADASFDKFTKEIESKLAEMQTNLLQKNNNNLLDAQKAELQQLINVEKTKILEAQTTAIDNAKSGLIQQMNDLISVGGVKQADVDLINKKLKEIEETQLKAIGEKLTKVEGQTNSLVTKLEALEQSVAGLKGSVTMLNDAMKALPTINSTIVELKAQLTKIEGTDAEQKKAITTLKSFVDEAQNVLGAKDIKEYGEKLSAVLAKVDKGVSIESLQTELQQVRAEMPTDYVKLQDLLNKITEVKSEFQTELQTQLNPLRFSLDNVNGKLGDVEGNLNGLSQKPKQVDDATNKVILDLNTDLYNILSSVGKVSLDKLSNDLTDFRSIKASLIDDLRITKENCDTMEKTLNAIVDQGAGFKLSQIQKIQIESFMAKLDDKAEKVASTFNQEKLISYEGFFEADFLAETVKALNEVVVLAAYKHVDKSELINKLDVLSKLMPKDLTLGNIIKETKFTSHGGNYVFAERWTKGVNIREHEHIKSFYNQESKLTNKDSSFSDFIISLKNQLDKQGFNSTVQDQMKSLNANVEDLLNDLAYLDTANKQHWNEAVEKIHLASVVYDNISSDNSTLAKEQIHKLMPDFIGHNQPLVTEHFKDAADVSH